MTNNRKNNANPVIGEVYMMKFDGSGSEQSGWRPGVVFQNNLGNKHSPNIIALPLTSAMKKTSQPTHVVVYADDTGLHKNSLVLCENPECLSKEKMGRYITKLSDEYMKQIAVASVLATGALSFFSKLDVLEIWERSMKLNCVA